MARTSFIIEGSDGGLTVDAMTGLILKHHSFNGLYGYPDVYRLDIQEWLGYYPQEIPDESVWDVLDFAGWTVNGIRFNAVMRMRGNFYEID